jgi:DNA-binding response OmpR family regulator
MNILYVENHAVFAENVKQQFLSGHSVTIVPSLSVARKKMADENFDLLLIDYDLDDGKGDELVRELRVSGSQITVIAVSSHNEGNTALVKAGATTVCSKMEFDNIQQVINSVNNVKQT